MRRGVVVDAVIIAAANIAIEVSADYVYVAILCAQAEL